MESVVLVIACCSQINFSIKKLIWLIVIIIRVDLVVLTTTMQHYESTASILLANGSLCRWIDRNDQTIRPVSHAKSVSASGLYVNMQAALTHDGRVLVGNINHETMTDVTKDIYDRLGGDLGEPISEIYVYKWVILVRAGNRVCIAYMEYEQPAWCRNSKLYTFPCGINLIRFGDTHGFIRTNDNCLYLTDGAAVFNDSMHLTSSMTLEPIDITDAQDISDIIYGPCYSLFVMNDDSVRVHGWANIRRGGKLEGILPLELCQTESIVKVISRGVYIFYITAGGNCYYNYILSQLRRRPGEECYPVQIRALAGLVVKNVFVTSSCTIVQHDGYRLCVLPQEATERGPAMDLRYIWGTREAVIDLEYVQGTKTPIPLPFFDDKGIVDITQAYHRIYFTTSEGHVYQARSDRFVQELIAERVEFFDENPVAVERSAPRLASTRSCLDD